MVNQKYFDICDKSITVQPAFRTNPNHLACASCDSTEWRLGTDKGSHSASLRCGECDLFIRSIGRSDLSKIEKLGALR